MPNRSSLPQPCKLPGCGNTFTGHGSKRFCSRRCTYLHHRRFGNWTSQTNEYQKQQRLKRTQVNLITAPPCSICQKSTARVDYQHKKSRFTDSMMPAGFHLCKTHRRGYANFLWKNGYEGLNAEDIFTAFLVGVTFNSDNREYMRMMRESFKISAD
jgi:hypothetical protein